MRASVPDLLGQTEVWLRDGELVPLTELTTGHLSNLGRWLMAHAEILKESEVRSLYSAGNFMSGEMALDSIDHEIAILEEKDPEEWMREQPLHEAIEAELEKRWGK